jgi:tRNA1Val (adenine37-N6)-methyltransferase
LATPDFRFKQFTIRHDRSAMKVGTDGVLLGAWAGSNLNTISTPFKILDVGTGTGLIALMMAQRFPAANIVGIDIDEASLEQAKENVESTPFKARISIEKQDYSDINSFSNQFDLIVSNPPFYTEDTLGGNPARDKARHTTSLPFETLVENAAKLLTEEGLFSVIIPYQSAADFISICVANRLYLTRRLNIRSTERKPFNRVLLEFSMKIQPSETNTLTLYDANNNRSPEYAQLTQDFYL